MLSLPNPCSEDFSKMTPTERGQYCSKCQIDTIDFRRMSNEKILDTLIEHQSKHLCGSFYPNQIEDFNGYVERKKALEKLRRRYLPLSGILVMSALFCACQQDPEFSKGQLNVVEEKEIQAIQLRSSEKLAGIFELKEYEIEEPIPPPVIEEFQWDAEWYSCKSTLEDTIIELNEVIIKERQPYNEVLGGEIMSRPLGGVPVYDKIQVSERPGLFQRWKEKRRLKKALKNEEY